MFESITPTQLAEVTGGGAPRIASGAGSADMNKTMTLAVQQLQSTIQSVAQQFSSGQSDSQNMQQMMGMMMQMKGH